MHMLHAKLRNRTCQGLDRQGQGQGQGPSLQGPGQGHDKDKDLNLVLESLRTRTRLSFRLFIFPPGHTQYIFIRLLHDIAYLC